MVFGACAGGDESLPELGEATEALVTGVIPTSRLCSPFVTPEGCVAAPASEVVLSRPGPATKIDGVRGKNEYHNAAELPYADTLHKATGTVYVRAHQDRMPGSALTTASLSVFLEDLPFRTGGREGKFLVIVDEDRFTGSTTAYEAGDHYFELDFQLGTATETRITNSYPVVRSYTNFQMGACTIDPSTSELARCSAELRIPLRPSAVRPFKGTESDLIPGVGFGVFPVRPVGIQGGIPELTNGQQTNLKTNRKLLLTLLLGRPQGFPLQYATWNVRRSAMDKLAGPYLEVGDDAIGTYLASLGANVIALQEAWNEAKVESVVLAANAARAAASTPLPPLVAHGPVNHESTTIRDLVEEIGGLVLGTDGSSGGLYTLTSLPVAKSDFHAFSLDNCKGEDCLKAKGVQWTRILLNPPNPANSTCLVTGASRTCPAPPSGGEYIDVFNLHLQASEPSLCSDETKMKLLLANIAAFTIPDPVNMPWLVAALATVNVLAKAEFHCDKDDRKVRAAQLAETSAFIDRVTGDRKDRPVVIMGDFNIDGRTLGSEYRSMLKLLRIGPAASTNDDWINPWRYDYTWDFDHGDLAREFVTNWPKDGACMGTFLWDIPMPIIDCPYGGNVDGLPPLAGQRFDYILLRPPYAIDDPNFVAAKWVAARIKDKTWTSPYPGPGQPLGQEQTDPGPPIRLSDHKPVLVGIEHAKLQQPPKFHKTWKHDATFRVTSADASNQSDCLTCGPVDPITRNYDSATDWSQDKTFLQYAYEGSECENRTSVSWPAQSCMNDWSFKAKHDPALVTAHDYVAMLYDYDYSSDDEAMPVTEYFTWPLIAMEWTVPEVARTSLGGIVEDVPWPVYDTEPIPWCLGRYPTKMCLEVKTTELPPGQQ